MAARAPRRFYIPVFEALDQRRGGDGAGPGLADMPPELLHLVAFGFWILDARDIAALRAACRYFWGVFPAAGLDLAKWEARAGPDWCVANEGGLLRSRARRVLKIAFGPGTPFRGQELRALWWACGAGDLRLARRLVALAPAAATENDSYALRVACASATVAEGEIVQLLLDAGADPRTRGDRCLLVASANGHPGAVRRLLAAGCQPTSFHLEKAAGQGHAEVVELLIGAGAVVSERSFMEAATRGLVNALKPLLAAADGTLTGDGVPIMTKALTWAAFAGDAEAVSDLLSKGADPLHKRSVSLQAACNREHFGIASILLEAGADPDHGFRGAGQAGNPEAVRFLSSQGYTPHCISLWYAADRDHLETAKELIECGVELNSDAITAALEAACAKHHPRMVEFLLQVSSENGFECKVDYSYMNALRYRSPELLALLDAHAYPMPP